MYKGFCDSNMPLTLMISDFDETIATLEATYVCSSYCPCPTTIESKLQQSSDVAAALLKVGRSPSGL